MEIWKTRYVNEITCPYCGYKFSDSWEYNNYGCEEIIDCGKCEKEFVMNVEVSVTYSTCKMEDEL